MWPSIRVAAIALLLTMTLAPLAAAETLQQIVAFLNHQRVTNGILAIRLVDLRGIPSSAPTWRPARSS
jgi:hypothetical protein